MLRLAQHLELDQVPAARLARQAQRADRVLGGEAAGGVGQIGDLLRVDEVGQHRRLGIGDVDPAHRDGDDLRARASTRGGVLREILVLAGADDQPRAEGAAGDGPAVVVDCAGMIAAADEMDDLQLVAVLDEHARPASSAARSPGCARPRPWRASSPSSRASAASVSPAATRRCSPLTRDRNGAVACVIKSELAFASRCCSRADIGSAVRTRRNRKARTWPTPIYRAERPQPQPAGHCASRKSTASTRSTTSPGRLEDRARDARPGDRLAPVQP